MLKALNVAVIGGGMAGLAAAATLAEKGIKSTLFEAGSQLGGRARGVAVEFNSQVVSLDNGQHILLGAYHETLKLLAKVGMPEEQAFMRLPLMLEALTPNGKLAFKFAAPSFLPHPFDQLMGFLCCKGLTLGERFSVVKFMFGLKQANYQINADVSLKDYLEQAQQSAQIVKLLWEPLCLSALNTPIHL